MLAACNHRRRLPARHSNSMAPDRPTIVSMSVHSIRINATLTRSNWVTTTTITAMDMSGHDHNDGHGHKCQWPINNNLDTLPQGERVFNYEISKWFSIMPFGHFAINSLSRAKWWRQMGIINKLSNFITIVVVVVKHPGTQDERI